MHDQQWETDEDGWPRCHVCGARASMWTRVLTLPVCGVHADRMAGLLAWALALLAIAGMVLVAWSLV